MASAYDAKTLLDLMQSDTANKSCIDCGTPHPQWISLTYSIYICLNCSGQHRSLGTHLSFVRSLTMDKFTEVQVNKLRSGGNAKCLKFFEASPEYSKDMLILDKYNSHFALQYKDKLLASIEGRDWSPEDTPRPAPTHETVSALRKPRASTQQQQSSRNGSPLPSRSSSSASNATNNYNSSSSAPTSSSSPYPTEAEVQKSRKEDYFASMGSTNDSRSSDLPPSQGGKYGGFGSGGSYNPSDAMSSRALPSVDDFRDDPVGALGRGWGVFGAALRTASKTINETVVQPTLERATDPSLQSSFSSYLNTASSALSNASRVGGSALASGLSSGGDYIRRDLGYDVGDLGASFVEGATSQRTSGGGYGRVGELEAPTGSGVEDFFGQQMASSSQQQQQQYSQRPQQKSQSPRMVRNLTGGADGQSTRISEADLLGSTTISSSSSPSIPQRKSTTLSPIPPPPSASSSPAVAPEEDGWAKLAPASNSRLNRSRTTSSNNSGSGSAGVSRTSSPALGGVRRGLGGAVEKKVVAAPVGKKDDWDDFNGDEEWK